jgi:hypothetical protein
MRLFVLLIDNGILRSGSPCAQLGIIILSDLLVGFLRSLRTGALDRLGDIVCCVLIR